MNLLNSCALILWLICLFLYYRKQITGALLMLSAATFVFGISLQDSIPYLNIWDEQYHALVAKNMADGSFLKPVLRMNPILTYDFKNWPDNYVWLHKQPLFLWQMALSIKLFGNTLLAVRLPSLLMHALLPLVVYRIGKIITQPVDSGFWAAMLTALAYYPTLLSIGALATDHNDIAFLFYTSISLWAWFEYQESQKRFWLLLIGIFSGCAILVKWLVGLLVFAGWFVINAVDYSRSKKIKVFIPLVLSFVICLMVFLPWQVFILHRYANEALYEYAYNTRHLFEVIEDHKGDIFYHWNAMTQLYGDWPWQYAYCVPFLILIALVFLLIHIRSSPYKIFVVVSIGIVHLFYAIVATKMPAFTLILSPFIFIALANAPFILFKRISKHNLQSLFTIGVSLVLCVLIFNPHKLIGVMIKSETERNEEARYKNMFTQIDSFIGNKPTVIFNCNAWRTGGQIPIQFFTPHLAYDRIPEKKEIETAKHAGYPITVIDDGRLPNEIRLDTSIVKLCLQP